MVLGESRRSQRGELLHGFASFEEVFVWLIRLPGHILGVAASRGGGDGEIAVQANSEGRGKWNG